MRQAVFAIVALSCMAWSAHGYAKPIQNTASCAAVTSDWPLWSALSPVPWKPEEIQNHHYSDEEDPQTVIADDTAGAFMGHGADSDLAYSPESLTIIEHMLAAPSEAVCGDAVGESLRLTIDTLIHSYSPLLLQSDREAKLDLSRESPLFVAFQLLEYSAFRGRSGVWIWDPRGSANAGTDEAHSFAKTRWSLDKNPLWALAVLENSTDPQDLQLLGPALERLRHWPNLAQSAKSRYVWRLVAQHVRLSLDEGRNEKALAAARDLEPADRAALTDADAHPDVRATADLIVNSSARRFIENNNHQGARVWALAANVAFDWPIANELKPLLVEQLTEFYGSTPLALDRTGGEPELGPARAIFDGWPADALIDAATTPGMAADDRRAIIGAAWVRAYASDRDDKIVAWLPIMQAAFPQLAADLATIGEAGDRVNRRHKATMLLLRAPGLVALPSWARPPGGPRHMSAIDKARPEDIRAFDLENGNDGNWWCDLDAEQVKGDSVEDVIGWSREGQYAATWLNSSIPRKDDVIHEDRRADMIAEVNRRMAAFPIFKPIDAGELDRLAAGGSAVKMLADDGLAWAETYRAGKARAEDAPLIAESLALIVRAARFGCHRGSHNGQRSKAAYDALHQLFPDSEWAAKTPHWFGALK